MNRRYIPQLSASLIQYQSRTAVIKIFSWMDFDSVCTTYVAKSDLTQNNYFPVRKILYLQCSIFTLPYDIVTPLSHTWNYWFFYKKLKSSILYLWVLEYNFDSLIWLNANTALLTAVISNMAELTVIIKDFFFLLFSYHPCEKLIENGLPSFVRVYNLLSHTSSRDTATCQLLFIIHHHRNLLRSLQRMSQGIPIYWWYIDWGV